MMTSCNMPKAIPGGIQVAESSTKGNPSKNIATQNDQWSFTGQVFKFDLPIDPKKYLK